MLQTRCNEHTEKRTARNREKNGLIIRTKNWTDSGQCRNTLNDYFFNFINLPILIVQIVLLDTFAAVNATLFPPAYSV